MFTGIVQGYCEVTAAVREGGVTQIVVELGELARGLESGASVALNGCCLTATDVGDTSASFDMVDETMTLSNLGELVVGDRVNVERSFRVGDEIGGHILSGHIACAVPVCDVQSSEGHKVVSVEVPKSWLKYLMNKGFVVLNGASLTIAELDRNTSIASVSLIPETLARTSFQNVAVGERINLEVDSRTQAVVDTVQAMLRDENLVREILR